MSALEAKEAIVAAKNHLAALFADELDTPPTLEEIWHGEATDQCCVTLGVRRASNHVEGGFRDILVVCCRLLTTPQGF